MAVRRGTKSSGVRDEVLRRLRGLEQRCEMIEREVSTLGLAERLRVACRRIAELEAKSKAA